MKFSQRSDWPAAANPLAQLIETKKSRGAPLIDLTRTNPTLCEFNFLEKKWLEPLSDAKNLFYEPSAKGLLEARRAVCGYYAKKKILIDPDQVFLTAGTSEAYTFIFSLLCDPRDLVAAPRPSYPLFDYLTTLADVDIIRYFLSYEDRWGISTDSLEIPFIEKPKLLVLVNPNNPTGNFVKAEELEFINKLCQRSQTAIISDEVFLDFVFDGRKTKPLSLAGNRETLTLTLGGVSKSLGLPQMKVSWIVVNGPPDLKEKALERLEVIADTYLSVNTPSQRALGMWLSHQETAQSEIIARLRQNFQCLEKAVEKSKEPEILSCEGGWAAILKLRPGKSDEETALRLLKNNDLIVHPGYFFDFGEGEFLVVSLLLPPKLFSEGVERLRSGLA